LQLATRDAAVLVDFCAWFGNEELGDAAAVGAGGVDATEDRTAERTAVLDRFLAETLLRDDVLKV
jgi:hypothetical protein